MLYHIVVYTAKNTKTDVKWKINFGECICLLSNEKLYPGKSVADSQITHLPVMVKF